MMNKKALPLILVLFITLATGQNWSQVKNLAGPRMVQDDEAPATAQRDAPAQVVMWHHSWSEDPANIADLAESGFVTHVLISNLDFNEEPESSIAEKIQIIRDHGLIPIWGRWLWFQDGSESTAEFAQPFVDDYADGTIVFNADYYAWFLQALRAEAARYGVDLVAVDVEPYGDPNNLRTILRGDGTQEWFDRVQQAVHEALSRPSVTPADYIYPTDMFIVEYNGYRALSGLGTNKITEVTYFDCDSRLNWALEKDFQLTGAWVTAYEQCYRQGSSCLLSNYGQSCPWSDYALWGPQTIFDNVAYWHDVGRGLFLYAANREGLADDLLFPKALATYCQTHASVCEEFAPIPPPSQCVQDVNANGVGDVVDVMATAAELPCHVYLPVVVARWHQPWPTPTPTPSPTPTPTPMPPSNAIVLADGPGGLELVSAPSTIPITVGHVTYLPVEVQNYHRPITVSAQTLIHTYVNDMTAAQPGESSSFAVGQLTAQHNELKLQTLRMRAHPLTLSFTPVGQVGNLPYTLTLELAIQPRTPLFGVHSPPFYAGLPEPFTQVWGPNCGSCPTTEGDPPGSTRDLACARQQDSCHCHPIQKTRDPEAEAHTRHAAPQMQRYASQFLRSVGGWGQVQIEPGRYLWDGLDWTFNDLSPQERDYSPLFTGILYGNFGWMTCPAYTNPDGSVGFYDPDNTYLLQQYGAYVRELTARYAPELRFIETGNEPCYGFYLCPCLDPGGPPCDATGGPNQPACALGHDSEEFAQTYGPFLSTSANVAAQAMAKANPDALLIAGALEKSGEGLTATTRYMIEHGMLDRGNVALMIHQFPLPWPNWLPHPVDCAYFQDPNDPWWLPAGCQTAPPFEDYTTPTGRPIHAQDMWRAIDEKIDASPLLHDAEDLGVLDRFYLFDTELHAGFHDNFGGEPNQTTTPAREAMAGLRIGAINAHQRYLGLEFIFAPADPTAYNLMVKHLAGVTPVYAWDAPLTDADYSGLVYKLFTRPVGQVPGTSEVPGTSIGEDIIAIWSNADDPLDLTLTPSALPTRFKQVTLTRLVDAHGSVAITKTNLSAPPATIPVQPLREFYFLSVISDRPGFGWLAGLMETGQ